MKEICVIGLGQFGMNVALKLSELGVHVLAIDSNRDKVNWIKDKVMHAVHADVRDTGVLNNIIPPDLEAVVVAIGESIESSILCTLHLKKLKIKKIIVKAVTNEHAEILSAIGVRDIIFPERDMAVKLANSLLTPNLLDYLPISDDYSIIELAPPQEFIGKSLLELELRKRYKVWVVALKNVIMDDIQFMPLPETVIKHDDILVVIGKNESLGKIKNKR